MIFLTCDEGPYLMRETQWAIRSLARHAGRVPVLLMICNGTGRYDREIRRWHPAVRIEPFVPQGPVRYGDPGFFFAFKLLALPRALREAGSALLFLDGDVVVRGSLAPVFDALQETDFTIRYRPSVQVAGPMGTTHGGTFNSGVMGLAGNERTLAFVDELKARTERHLAEGGAAMRESGNPRVVTGIDQEVLWVVFDEMRDRVRFQPLDDRFNDAYFRSGSAIWHAKGTGRKSPMYRYATGRLAAPLAARRRHAPDLVRHRLDELLRRWARRRLVRRVFHLEGQMLDRAAGPGRVLVVNSYFLVVHPALRRPSVVCVDLEPEPFHANRALLRRRHAGAHRFVTFPEDIDLREFDLVVGDHTVARIPGAAAFPAACSAPAWAWGCLRPFARRPREPKTAVVFAPGSPEGNTR